MSAPSWNAYIFRKLRIISPAPTSRTIVSASSTTTMRRREPSRAAASGIATSAFLQDLVDVRLRDLQRRRQAEQDPGREADGGQVTEHDRIEGERHPVRLAGVGDCPIEQLDADGRQSQAQDTADEGEQRALDQQLPDDARAAGAQGDAHRDLASARARSARAGDWRRWRRRSAGRTRRRRAATGRPRGSARR